MRFAIVILLVFLTGCATAPPTAEAMKAVPAMQIVALPNVTSPTPAKVRVVRDEGFVASAVFMHLGLDGKRLVSLMPGEFIDFSADPGEYLMTAMPTDPFGVHHPTTLDAVWRASQRYTYRLGMDANMKLNLFRVAN